MTLTHELEVAIAAVRAACKATKHVQKTMLSLPASEMSRIKCDRSPVTKECSGLLREEPPLAEKVADAISFAGLPRPTLDELFDLIDYGRSVAAKVPQDIDCRRNTRYWTVDPVDGTKGFLRHSQYAVCVALLDHASANVLVAVLGCPNLPETLHPDKGSDKSNTVGVLLYASRGGGAFQVPLIVPADGGPPATALHVSTIKKNTRARCLESFEVQHTRHDIGVALRKHLNIAEGKANSILMDSQCKYAVLARGDAEIYSRLVPNDSYRENIWDHASGYLITTEAGGIVTDVEGSKLVFTGGPSLINNRGILASCGPPTWHIELLKCLRKSLSK